VALIRCPVCREKFKWDITQGYPEQCLNPECASRIAHDREDDDIVLPFVRSSERSKTIDNVYRDMERGSEQRAQMAAEMTGAPVSEMSDLRITNLNDRQRPGDIAAQPVNNPVSQFMQANPGIAGFAANGAAFAGGVSAGHLPNVGAKMRSFIQGQHSASGHVTSEIPTIETHYNPGYRWKG
jgi:hypothetical protein